MVPRTRQINQLVALRMGELWPPMLGRAIATVDQLAEGRICINIISSDLPELKESNEVRYAGARSWDRGAWWDHGAWHLTPPYLAPYSTLLCTFLFDCQSVVADLSCNHQRAVQRIRTIAYSRQKQ